LTLFSAQGSQTSVDEQEVHLKEHGLQAPRASTHSSEAHGHSGSEPTTLSAAQRVQ